MSTKATIKGRASLNLVGGDYYVVFVEYEGGAIGHHAASSLLGAVQSVS
jgi:hypothetical protein